MQAQLTDLIMLGLGQYEHDAPCHEHATRDVAPSGGFFGAQSGIIGVEARGITYIVRAMGRSSIFLGVRPKHEIGSDPYADNAQRGDPDADILLSKEATT